MHRHAISCSLFALLASACVPKVANPRTTDLDKDGIVDADDQCMADPEDIDGLEDSDGCPEPGEAPLIGDDGEVTQVAKDPEVKRREMQRSKAGPLQQSKASARATPYRKGAWGAAIDHDERAYLVFGFGKAWVGWQGGGDKPVRGDVYQAVFSPSGSKVAMVGAKSFSVLEGKGGKAVRSFPFAKGTEDSPESKLLRWQDDDTLVFYDGCQVQSAQVSGKAKPKALSSTLCGQPLAADNGRHWYVYQQDDVAVQVHKLDLSGGEPTLILGGKSDEAGLSQILLSPNGKHLCYSRHKDGSAFTCRNNESSEELVVWAGPTDTRAAFNHAGLLGVGAGPLRSTRDFLLADLDKASLRRLGELGAKDEWLAPVGDQSFVASGGQDLAIFDLAKGQQISVPLDAGEWEGFSAIPGREREFILGKERTATRDLYRIQVQ